MCSEGHDSFRTGGDPLVPTAMSAIVVNMYVLSVLVDDLSFDPLSGGVSDINPLSFLKFSFFELEGSDILYEVGVEALYELVNGMFVLL